MRIPRRNQKETRTTVITLPTQGCLWSEKGSITIAGKKSVLGKKSLVLITRGKNHEIRNTGTTDLVTLNFYVPPAYAKAGEELATAKPR